MDNTKHVQILGVSDKMALNDKWKCLHIYLSDKIFAKYNIFIFNHLTVNQMKNS